MESRFLYFVQLFTGTPVFKMKTSKEVKLFYSWNKWKYVLFVYIFLKDVHLILFIKDFFLCLSFVEQRTLWRKSLESTVLYFAFVICRLFQKKLKITLLKRNEKVNNFLKHSKIIIISRNTMKAFFVSWGQGFKKAVDQSIGILSSVV